MRRSPEQTRPEFRRLRIFAIDPMLARAGEFQATVQIRFEELTLRDEKPPHELRASFRGRRLEVVDCDTSFDPEVWLTPVDLDNASIAMQHGLEPAESDPQFHQQMVYAVAMRTLEQFDRALGRVVYFRGQKRLRLVPHAFRGRNAFFHPRLRAVLFGYFPASEETPGENMPGQTIFTCLSHDIVAHEVTHAIVDRLRPGFNVATNPHVRAFHEAFADVVAIFQRLSYRELVHTALEHARGNLGEHTPLSDFAAQFGQGLGQSALRSVLDVQKRLADVSEEHDMGAVLVAAIFEGFRETYDRRCADLRRLATGGSGVLPEGALHPDLVNRLTQECVRTAQAVLTMCIRAFDFLPPADVTLGLFLRALVTADWDLNPQDESGLRGALIEACRRRGIYAEGTGSLAVNALLLDSPPRGQWDKHRAAFREWVDLAVRIGVEEQRRSIPEDFDPDGSPMDFARAVQQSVVDRAMWEVEGEDEASSLSATIALKKAIGGWANALDAADRALLSLAPLDRVTPVGFHPSYRTAADGTMRFGLIVQLVTERELVIRGATRKLPHGATLVIDVNGEVRHVVRSRAPEDRLVELEATAGLAATDRLGWGVTQGAERDPFAVDYSGLHAGRHA